MENRFFEKPVLNSPCEYAVQYWELDARGQPTRQLTSSTTRGIRS